MAFTGYSDLTYNQMLRKTEAFRLRSQALEVQMIDRARQLAREAGLSPEMVFLHAHNATVGRNGKFWTNVDYTKVHQILVIEQNIFKLHRLYDRYSRRLWCRCFEVCH